MNTVEKVDLLNHFFSLEYLCASKSNHTLTKEKTDFHGICYEASVS